MLLFICVVHFSLGEEIGHYKEIQPQKNQKASAAPKEKNFYIIPRIGLSSFTGFIGIELQYKHFAFGIGYIYAGDPDDHTLMYGIKYYFKPYHSTWYIGLGGIAQGEFIDEDEGKTAIGFILGYRWRFWKGFDFNLGMGPLFAKGKNPFTAPIMFELAFGYSF
jgi:hypothetical protein